jgi:hypothetical protein
MLAATETRCALRGPSDNLVIAYGHRGPTDLLPRAVLAATCLCLTALLIFMTRAAALREWLARWPYVVGVAIGCVWWLWLTPSLLGLCIAMVCVIGALRPGWQAF